MKIPKVLVVATSRKTRGGITSVVKAHQAGEQWNKYHCKWIETHRDGNQIIKLYYFITALIEYIALLPFYDIVHIHVGLRASVKRKYIFSFLAKICRKKIIIHFHPSTEKHLFDKELGYQIKRLFDTANLLLVLSPQWVKLINKAFPDREYNIQILYNPCSCVTRNLSAKKKNILYAGTLNDRKGYNRLIKGFSLIANKYPEWKLVFAGNGEIDKGRQLQKDLNIKEEQVVFLGWVSGKKKEKVFQESSIYCLPSWGEGFPMGVLDAWSYGIPVITTPVGGIVDIGKNGEDYLLFDVYDIHGLARCLEELISSEEKRNKMVKSADKLLKQYFNINDINNQLSDIYSRL